MAGYSGTPLARKLGFTEKSRLWVINSPEDYHAWVEPLPEGLVLVEDFSSTPTIVHLFVTERSELEQHLITCRARLAPDATLWVSWPKKSSKVPTDITEDAIRALALPLQWVDIKVCAVSEVWSGLKLVVRVSAR